MCDICKMQASKAKKWYFVAPSSIPGTGLGLYAAVDIQKDTLLPGCYAGLYITSKQYVQLISELEAAAKQAARRTRTRVSDMEDDGLVRRLRTNYGVELVPPRTPVRWDLVCKGMTDYAFEGEEENDGTTLVTILPKYNVETGKPVYDLENPPNPFLLMNEPPATHSVHNRYLDAWQKSAPNVIPVLPSETGSHSPALRFRTAENIPANTELFLCYGSMYDRRYAINMSFQCGCGKFDDVSSNLNESVTRRQYNQHVSRHGYVPESFLSRSARNDQRVMDYVMNVSK